MQQPSQVDLLQIEDVLIKDIILCNRVLQSKDISFDMKAPALVHREEAIGVLKLVNTARCQESEDAVFDHSVRQ